MTVLIIKKGIIVTNLSQFYIFDPLYKISVGTEKANQRKFVFPSSQSAGPNLSVKDP